MQIFHVLIKGVHISDISESQTLSSCGWMNRDHQSDFKFVKKFTLPFFLCQKFYTLKMRKSGLILPTIDSVNLNINDQF